MRNINIFKSFAKRGFCACLIVATALASGFYGCDEGEESLPETISTKPESSLKADTIRLLSYNILEGMKMDKDNNYDNFVAWVKSVDPDILALQEANKLTDAILTGIASRYGHQHVVTNIKAGDSYPVALTSKYPVEIVGKMTDAVSHGALHVRIKGVNFVVLHLYPQGAGANGHATGDAYRLAEINIFVNGTIRKYPAENKWFMMGDFNAYSPVDKYDFPNGEGQNYAVHNVVLNAGYVDAMRYMHPAFISSVPTGMNPAAAPRRIDFIYGTETMMREMIHAEIIKDDFTYEYSDHYPVMVDFRIYEE